MPLCGFKPRMIAGIKEFGEGIFEQAQEKAEKDGLTLGQSVDVEIEETGMFLEMLAQDPEKNEALIGVAHLARAMYRNAKGSKTPEKNFSEGVSRLLVLLKDLDDKYYQDFHPGNNARDAIEKLGKWMRQRK